MKRFKKLAAGMVAAGMALAMLPVAAAQAANMRTLTIETKVAGADSQDLQNMQIEYYVYMNRAIYGAGSVGFEAIPDGTTVAGSVFKDGLARYTTTPDKKLVLPFTVADADKYDYSVCMVQPINVDVSPAEPGLSGCTQSLWFAGIGEGRMKTNLVWGKLDQDRTQTVTFSKRFRDVNASTPHLDDVDWLSYMGISMGWKEADGTTTFRGMSPVVRQDMAAFLRREAVKRNISDAASWKPSVADRKWFRDVTCTADNKGNMNTPHCEDILWLAHAGISEGWKEKDGSSTFRGMDTVKRQDMAAFLKRLAAKAGKGGDVKPKTDFTDVFASTPHRAEIQWLGGSGISEGYRNANGTWRFEGMTSVYRQDMAAFIHRLDNLLAK
ncbi:hypothetical protein [Bifidobacterium pseudolongum]|uniref:hypothetical protein n=1 Tax=Bifidobacterium pseudolongum TaxID=1694 RepID=UPI00101F94A2|nr:hypothetical protein [Bifidobacterium pseudolongum]